MIKFNAAQLKNPTPSKISNMVAVASVILGIFIGWLGTQDVIAQHLASNLQSVGGLVLAILNGLKPFFGVEPVGTTVPVDKVTAMDDPGKQSN